MDDRDLPFGRIGPYRLEARLGRGGMGEVFLARDERLGRRVAIKRVRWGPGIPASTLERLRREARATARLNHPAIVQVYDLIPDGEGDAMVMEYVLGRSLDTLVGDPSLTAAGAVRLAGEVAAGLAHAHSAGFVHRDLKGENVMVSGAGHAKILDFGLAKPVLPGIEDSLTVDGAVIGTYRSMSPEQAGGDDEAGADREPGAPREPTPRPAARAAGPDRPAACQESGRTAAECRGGGPEPGGDGGAARAWAGHPLPSRWPGRRADRAHPGPPPSWAPRLRILAGSGPGAAGLPAPAPGSAPGAAPAGGAGGDVLRPPEADRTGTPCLQHRCGQGI